MRRKERERLAWEREASLADLYHDPRVEELGSSDDSDAQQGVGLNFSKKRFASDALQFTGIDLGAKPRAKRSYVYQNSDSEESSDSNSQVSEISERQFALREKEEALVQSALARIRRAHEKGKTEVRLNQDELEALDRRKQRMQAKKVSGESERRRRSNKVTVSIAPPHEIANARRRKHKQVEESAPPPGMLVAGPDGSLVYAPIGQYPSQVLSSNSPRTSSGGSSRGSPSSRPRSATNQSRNGSSPLSYYPQSASGRHISDPQTSTLSHPSSSPRLRDPLPHEEGWTRINSASSRRSSISSAASSSRHSQRTKAGGSPLADPFAYQIEDEVEHNEHSIPGQFLESPVSSRHPRDVVYSNIRRSLPGQTYSTHSSNTGLPASTSDPSLSSSSRPRTRDQPRRNYQDQNESSESSESSDADELAGASGHGHGVKVNIAGDDELPSRGENQSQRVRPKDSAIAMARKPVGSGNGSVRSKKGRKGK